jgi:hypothetical protein
MLPRIARPEKRARRGSLQFLNPWPRRSLITPSRVGSFRAGRHGDSMRKLLTIGIARAALNDPTSDNETEAGWAG